MLARVRSAPLHVQAAVLLPLIAASIAAAVALLPVARELQEARVDDAELVVPTPTGRVLVVAALVLCVLVAVLALARLGFLLRGVVGGAFVLAALGLVAVSCGLGGILLSGFWGTASVRNLSFVDLGGEQYVHGEHWGG